MPTPRLEPQPVQVKLDSKGRITIPEEMRSRNAMKNGDLLYLVESDGTITLFTYGQLVESIRRGLGATRK